MSKLKKTTAMDWPEVEVRHPPDTAEAVAYFLFESGALAVIQDDTVDLEGWWTSRAAFKPGSMRGDPAKSLTRFLSELVDIFDLDKIPTAKWRKTRIGDWAEKWKEGLAPIEIGDMLVIKPSWCKYEAGPNQVVVELDPGLAFGTGHHASTFMCLEALTGFLKQKPADQIRILDVGAGSGILALACAAFGRNNVAAIDIDPEVLPVAAHNLAVNGLSGRVVLACAEPAAIRGSFDLLLANLTSEVLIRLSTDLNRLGSARCTLILSGILDEQADGVNQCFAKLGFETHQRLEQGEWVALILVREE